MDSRSNDTAKCCDCGCDCSLINTCPNPWIKSVKRKHDEFENRKPFNIPELESSLNAKVEIENEIELLRETLRIQQNSIRDLYAELDEERNAASTAANEAMSMILRLQREKADLTMELRQFKRFAEEKMEHDQQEILSLEDLVYKREQTIHALTCEAQAYKHRMMSFGVNEEDEFDSENKSYDVPTSYDLYPSLKCNLNDNPDVDVVVDDDDVEKYPLTVDSPLKTLEQRISHMEKFPSFTRSNNVDASQGKACLEKVVVEQRPGLSCDSPNSNNENDMSDRVYTIDSVHEGVSHSGLAEKKVKEDDAVDGYVEKLNQDDIGDPDIAKLYMRLQALEADRESMRQAIMSMRTERAQMVLLKEIAQQLSKDVKAELRLPLRKASNIGVFSFISFFKWLTSFVFLSKKTRRSKYMNGIQGNNMGLQMLLEKAPRIRQWRCLSSTQV